MDFEGNFTNHFLSALCIFDTCNFLDSLLHSRGETNEIREQEALLIFILGIVPGIENSAILIGFLRREIKLLIVRKCVAQNVISMNKTKWKIDYISIEMEAATNNVTPHNKRITIHFILQLWFYWFIYSIRVSTFHCSFGMHMWLQQFRLMCIWHDVEMKFEFHVHCFSLSLFNFIFLRWPFYHWISHVNASAPWLLCKC